MTLRHDGLEATVARLCGTCAARRGCAVEGAARVYWPEHPHFPAAWQEREGSWRRAAYQPPRLIGAGRIDDPTQIEMFPA
ncbi:hypothetical protein [Acidisoma sp. 7E03]